MSKYSYRHLDVFLGILIRISLLLAGIFFASDIFAGGTAQLTLSAINSNFSKGVGNIVSLMQDIATVAGVGFIFASFFKFHQHKMNPTQVKLSDGVTMLMVGAGLTVFPHLLNTTSQAVFGQSITKVGDTSIGKVVSGGS